MKFKIEYEPDRIHKYVIYRSEGRLFKHWEQICSFETFEEADIQMIIVMGYPKYYNI